MCEASGFDHADPENASIVTLEEKVAQTEVLKDVVQVWCVFVCVCIWACVCVCVCVYVLLCVSVCVDVFCVCVGVLCVMVYACVCLRVLADMIN